MKMFTTEEWAVIEARLAEGDRLAAIVNTPELIDFPKAVMLEAQHQEARWGTEDRQSKEPADWFRLVTHLSTRALAHHDEAERLQAEIDKLPTVPEFAHQTIAHHREKAVHHCITTAAALAHWHASVLGRRTSMRPGYSAPAEG